MDNQQQTVEATPRIRERILGVYNLMKGATTTGEFEAAKHQLDAMLAKYNLTLDDFINVEPPKSEVWFVCNNKMDESVLFQVFWIVTGKKRWDTRSRWITQRKFKIGIELTKVQAVDAALLFRTYAPAYRKAHKKMLADIKNMKKQSFAAFCYVNRLYGEDFDDGQEKPTMMTDEEMAALILMVKGIEKTEDPRKPGYLGDGK